ncbi:hypothetical protein GPA27_19085 [Aromatoleum toluolicum]|uniref:hypothetical protein n=1 Tax=Aromatoleum toluolicum TaxID=90060 RepID=UPI001B7D0E3E|nr:hypothetical protein [Aromatoleum toluolicum]MCQ6964020.1 hypothetical protein [Aromatoleum toluolicum]
MSGVGYDDQARIPENQYAGWRGDVPFHQVRVHPACLCRDTGWHAGSRFNHEIRHAIGHPAGDAQDKRRASRLLRDRGPAVPAADPAYPLPRTTVWSYGSANHPDTFNYPAFTIEARYGRPVRVKWINDLKDADGNFLPHLLAVDPMLHWANPPGGAAGRDMRPSFASTPGPYTGPVPIVTHLHGGHSAQESDGYAEAWYLPAANDIPAGFASEGTWYEFFKSEFSSKFGEVWEPGTATFQYENDQRASTFWYHDHTLGMTRLNVYAGPAGFYLLRRGPGDLPDPVLPGPAPEVGADPFGRFYEVPIAIQDRSFNADNHDRRLVAECCLS